MKNLEHRILMLKTVSIEMSPATTYTHTHRKLKTKYIKKLIVNTLWMVGLPGTFDNIFSNFSTLSINIPFLACLKRKKANSE